MLKIKVCGMRLRENIADLALLKPEIIGFIFYPESKRFVGFDFIAPDLDGVRKAGVFVNETTEKIIETAIKNNLDLIQLHGNEAADQCKILANEGFRIMKAISIQEVVDWAKIENYLPYCDHLLFDTQDLNHGGSGRKFNWDLLQDYPYKTTFFIGGGIGPDDIDAIKALNMKQFVGVDINSRFELGDGLKDIMKVKSFIETLRHETI